MSPLFPVPVGEHSGPALPAENSATAPEDYPIDTWVMVDGVKVPCQAGDLADGLPTVLDGLSFSWGRESSVDQPDTNTCSFTLREQIRPDEVTMLDTIHVGSTVEVWSGANVPADDAEVMRATGFSKWDGGTLPDTNWTLISGSTPDTPAVEPFNGSDPAAWFIRYNQFEDWTADIGIPPAGFATGDDQPNKWDLIPKLAPGTTWTIRATVWIPPGSIATLNAWCYSGPQASNRVAACPVSGSAATATGNIDELTGGTDGWFDLVGTITLPADQTDPAGLWVVPGLTLQALPSPVTWNNVGASSWADQVLRWMDLQRIGIAHLSMLQAEASPRTVLIWSGEVTSLVGQAAGDRAWTVAVTASDLSSILANVKVGDEPWAVMTVQERADAIMALIPTAPPLAIDTGLQATQVSYRDVDAQPPLGLLQDLAQTAGGVLWITAHATQGVYLWMEDPADRSAVRRFAIDADGAVYIDDGKGGTMAGVAVVSAMDILRDPVAWTQDVNSVITQASVTWLEQGTDEDGQTTTNEHTEVVQDDQASLDRYGIRDVSISTELISAADAEALAARVLALSRGTGWIASGLNMDTILLTHDIPPVAYSQRLSTVLDLLDATTRIGYAITVIDLPEWTPAGGVRSMYVEGGTYSWTDHRWQLELTATPATGQGESARWEDFTGTGITWEDFRPNRIKWLDAYGTGGPVIEQERAANG